MRRIWARYPTWIPLKSIAADSQNLLSCAAIQQFNFPQFSPIFPQVLHCCRSSKAQPLPSHAFGRSVYSPAKAGALGGVMTPVRSRHAWQHLEHDPEKLVLGLDPSMDTGFPPSRSPPMRGRCHVYTPLRRAKQGRKKSCASRLAIRTITTIRPITIGEERLAIAAARPHRGRQVSKNSFAVAGDEARMTTGRFSIGLPARG